MIRNRHDALCNVIENNQTVKNKRRKSLTALAGITLKALISLHTGNIKSSLCSFVCHFFLLCSLFLFFEAMI